MSSAKVDQWLGVHEMLTKLFCQLPCNKEFFYNDDDASERRQAESGRVCGSKA
jgi:hypothetical protein